MTELGDFIHTGRTLLLTDGLAKQLAGQVNLQAANVHVLAVNQKPDSLLTLTQPQLDELRAPMLAALGTTFEAPNRVALYLFTRGGWVVENFNDAPVDVTLNGHLLNVEARGWLCHWK